MARVIKNIKNEAEEQVPKVAVTEAKQISGGRLIDRDVYKAGQLAKQIEKDGEIERKRRLSEGLKTIALANEEAMVHGAADAFAEAAKAAITVFRNKSHRYADVESDLRVLVQEIVQKVLGTPAPLESKEYDAMVGNGVVKLRGRRRIKLEFSPGQLTQLKTENSHLIAELEKEIDFDLEEVPNVPADHVRVVTDVGSALCQQSAAMQSLSQII
jgi:hypothetical protein